MKKLWIACGLFIILGLTVACSSPANTPADKNVTDDMQTEETDLIEIIELKVTQGQETKVFPVEDYEYDLFRDDHKLNLNYMKGLDRFIYTYDASDSLLVMVYEDTTFTINFVNQTTRINYQESMANNLVDRVGDSLYLNLDAFQTWFDIDFKVYEDPFKVLELDMKSSGQVDKAIQAQVNQLPEKINMTWEPVYNVQPKIEDMYDMPGLDIISPVWFNLKSGQGDFDNKLNEDYIKWARSSGYKLWPAITNSFDLEMTRDLVTSASNRETYIRDLVAIYSQYDFHGINVDFENMYMEDRYLLNQFIAELTAAFHREGILVSMDVTFPGGSDRWSKCFDHEGLGQWLDFMVIMAYDQHWASSPVSGTVAGMTWLKNNLTVINSMVESDKLVLGLPFYMRVWYERPSQDQVNTMKVSSDSITMHEMESILANRQLTKLWDETTGQHYVSYINSQYQAVNKIWIEDAKSLRLKVDLVHTYNLKGVASWRRGYELQSIWPVIDDALGER